MFGSLSNWWNTLTGQGGSGDHGGSASVTFRPDKTEMEIAELLSHGSLMRIACEAMAEDIVRAWRTHGTDNRQWTDVEEEFEMRDVAEKAMFFAEGFGGAYILPRYSSTVVSAAALAKPRDVTLARGFLGFRVYTQFDVVPFSQTNNLRQPNGRPMFYSIRGDERTKIHYTWFRPFAGPTKVPRHFGNPSTSLEPLGQSRVDLIYDDFARALAGYSALSHILVKGNIDVLKVKGLASALARCNTTEEMSLKLNEIVVQAGSTITGANTFQPMVIDSEETIERKAGNHTGAADIVRELLTMFVASTRIPRTRLLGEQAKGLGNGGEADLTSYYDRCGSFRERRLTGVLNWMDSIVAPGSTTAWEYNPLWEMSVMERVEAEKGVAETVKLYVDAGVEGVQAAARKRLIETGFLPLEN